MTIIPLPGGWVALRPLTGRDENSVEAVDLAAALDLLDRVLSDRDGALVGTGDSSKLTVIARDRLLAALYQQIYGDLIASTVRCSACDKAFDLSFSLHDLIHSQSITYLTPDGVYQTEHGWHFRLITGSDELAVIGLPATRLRRALIERCTLMDETPDDATLDQIEAAMERIAPLLNMELSAPCPECGHEQPIGFDIQTFLLSRLIKDKARLAGEIHTLAMAYHWGLNEILNLKRSERRQYLALIDADARRLSARSTGGRRRTGA